MSANPRAPRLLVDWSPWLGTFWRNFTDLFRAEEPPLYLTSKPAPYWPDVFVNRRLPAAPFLESTGMHIATVLIVWVLTFVYVIQPKANVVAQKSNEKLTYYDVSEYLPPLDSGSAPAPKAEKGDPEYAKQPIVSLPPKPDNRMQTIVDPLHPVTLPNDVKIPNIVVWTPVPAAVPVAAAARGALTLPSLTPDVVPPTPSTQRADIKLPNIPQASVIEPPPTPDSLKRNLGDINMGLTAPTVEAPVLPTPVQRASAVGNLDSKGAPAAPPANVALGAGSGAQPLGQIIALGVHPAMPNGPIELPGGNRRGEFAAGPNGHPGAAGTPDKACCGSGPGGTGSGNGGPGSGNGANPSGVSVGAGPYNPGAAVQGNTPSNGAGTGHGGGAPSDLKTLMAKAIAPPRIPGDATTKSPDTAGPTAPSNASRIDDYTFGPKKYYTMTINMPNLTSAGGSWIIRFAELHQSPGTADLTAPVAMQKVDPAYPPDLIEARVEGRVILYAVIHADGTVGEARVLQGLDDRLDANAVAAIQRWHFRPATKNGSPVDLEAVVQIPFQIKKSPYGF